MSNVEYESKLYQNHAGAEEALQRLNAIGYDQHNISLVLAEADLPIDQNFASDTSPRAARGKMGDVGMLAGAATGGLIGALVGAATGAALVVGTGGVALPFVAGPIVAALGGLDVGLIGGTIVGGLLELGVEAEDWRTGLRNGGVGVIVSLKSHADQRVVRNALMNW